MKTKIVRKLLTMDKTITKEDEVEKEEENQEDRTEAPVIKMNPEDNLSQDNLKNSTNPSPSLTEENLDPSPIKDNLALNQNKTAETKANQKKE